MRRPGQGQNKWDLNHNIKMAHEYGLFIKASNGSVYTPEEFCDALRNQTAEPYDYEVVEPYQLIDAGKRRLYELMEKQITFEHKVRDYYRNRSKSGPGSQAH